MTSGQIAATKWRGRVVELFVARCLDADRDRWLAAASHWLTEEERRRTAAIPDAQACTLHAVGRALTRLIAAQSRGGEPYEIRIGTGAEGKPYLADHQDLWVNVAHSGDLVTVVVSETASTGVDVEQAIETRFTPAKLAARRFANVEAEYLATLPPERLTQEFLRFWTVKEAVAKALGETIFGALAGVVLEPCGGSSPRLVSVWTGPPAEQWTVHQLVAPGGAECVAIAVAAPDVLLTNVRHVGCEALASGRLAEMPATSSKLRRLRGEHTMHDPVLPLSHRASFSPDASFLTCGESQYP